jgi:hypothetical protein
LELVAWTLLSHLLNVAPGGELVSRRELTVEEAMKPTAEGVADYLSKHA